MVGCVREQMETRGETKMDIDFKFELKSRDFTDNTVAVLESEGILSKKTFKSLREVYSLASHTLAMWLARLFVKTTSPHF